VEMWCKVDGVTVALLWGRWELFLLGLCLGLGYYFCFLEKSGLNWVQFDSNRAKAVRVDESSSG